MQRIRIPLKIAVGSLRFLHGLTVRQMGYLVLAATAAGVALLSETDVALKLLVALAALGAGLAFAFVKPEGEWLEAWLLRQAGFRRKTHGYVWKGHARQRRVKLGPKSPTSTVGQPSAVPAARAPRPLATDAVLAPAAGSLSLAGVLVGFWLVAVTSALLIYLVRGGHLL